VTNKANGPALPVELSLSPLPAPAATDLTLQLVGANLPTINLDLHTFQFGARNPTTIGSATGGAGAGKMKFDALEVTADLSNASPDLLKVLASGGHYKTATLTETNADGQPIAVWVLGTVFVTNDTITKNQAGLPVEELKFVFGSATEATSTQRRSWNQVTNKADGPALPAGLVLSPLPGPTGTKPT
jgi:type VI secretion system secreted protein Hcp